MILKARDLIKLLARSIPAQQALKASRGTYVWGYMANLGCWLDLNGYYLLKIVPSLVHLSLSLLKIVPLLPTLKVSALTDLIRPRTTYFKFW